MDKLEKKFKVSLYIRVSTGRQANEGDSLEEQEKELKKFCEYKSYLIHKVHIERGRSAKDTNRPEYQKLLSDVKDKRINAVVVKKLDRLSRSLLDFEEFMKTAQANDVEFISLKENFDTTNAMGKAMLRVALVFAQLEREQVSERVSDVMVFRAEQGLLNGGFRPFGYEIIDKALVPHKQERKIVELIFNSFLENKSTTLVAQELNALGSRTVNQKLWNKNLVQTLLGKCVYIGKIRWRNTIYPGIHQPIVSEEKFRKVQEVFEKSLHRSPRNKIYGLLKGLLICGYCSNYLTPNYTRKKSGKLYFYYRCVTSLNQTKAAIKCRGQYIPMDAMHHLIIDELLQFASEENLIKLDLEIKTHNLEFQKEIGLLTAELQKLELSLVSIKDKKEKYLDSLISRNFSPNERKKINDKIDEYSLEEKQIQAAIYRQQFELSNKHDKLKSIEPFKQAIIQLKLNHESMSEKELGDWLKSQVDKIIYKEDQVKIEFKALI